ncbi:molecular chaperone [Erwinia sp. HDF1-3R]|uniref:fimbrial biogenesis chaperone n=1 Tax=Erwinia sp. HDF1-3R TaxID=3141543 RepID=UPI0031F48C10
MSCYLKMINFPLSRWVITALVIFFMSISARAKAYTESGSNGISFYVLRVIYPQVEKKGVTLKAENKTDSPFLFQSFIRPVDPNTGGVDLNYSGESTMPFIVTPPLARLEPHQTLDLRIRRNDQPLPTDRESVFYISMKAIPAQERSLKDGQLVMTVVTNMKIFYRPEGLKKRAVADVADRLTFDFDGNTLIASNLTPYWLTFSTLQVGRFSLDKQALRMMVPPYGKQRYPLPVNTRGDISWQLIDEDGWSTPSRVRSMLPSQ